MGQARGSTQLHQRMTALMDEVMGANAADRIHIYLGKRYLGGKTSPGARYARCRPRFGCDPCGRRQPVFGRLPPAPPSTGRGVRHDSGRVLRVTTRP